MHPLQQHNNGDAADIREQNAALSGINRTVRPPQVLIQRLLSYFPPAISAGNVQQLRIKKTVKTTAFASYSK